MPEFTFLLLHVADQDVSAAFYRDLLGLPVVERKDDFAALLLRDGVLLGLWRRGTEEPASSGTAGASEVAFAVADASVVEAMHADWRERGVAVLQAPARMSFGITFTAADPDGHRLRIWAPAT